MKTVPRNAQQKWESHCNSPAAAAASRAALSAIGGGGSRVSPISFLRLCSTTWCTETGQYQELNQSRAAEEETGHIHSSASVETGHTQLSVDIHQGIHSSASVDKHTNAHTTRTCTCTCTCTCACTHRDHIVLLNGAAPLRGRACGEPEAPHVHRRQLNVALDSALVTAPSETTKLPVARPA